MPETLKDQLSRNQEINLSVTGRKSGRSIAIPVWFVLDGARLFLLPVQGSDTQWYKNVQKNPSVHIDAGRASAAVKVTVTTDPKQVSSVVEKFRAKYGPSNVKKYYSKFDVAVLADLPGAH
jgi:deazaflavin-dependent oxidoreductase (nitroreductase family)